MLNTNKAQKVYKVGHSELDTLTKSCSEYKEIREYQLLCMQSNEETENETVEDWLENT